MENLLFVWRFCPVHHHSDLLINPAYASSLSLSIGLFIKTNPLDLTNVFIQIWASVVLSTVLCLSTAKCVFLSSAAWP